jgi:hypothetical protein
MRLQGRPALAEIPQSTCPVSGFGIVHTTIYSHEQTANRLGIAVSGVLTIRHGPLDLIEKNAGSISGLNNWRPQGPSAGLWVLDLMRRGRCRCSKHIPGIR